MATCVKISSVAVNGSYYLQLNGVTANADGASFLQPDTTTPLESCSMVMLSGSEYTQIAGTFVATPEDAMVISAAFAGLLAVGFVFRVLRRMIEETDIDPNS